MKRAALFAFGLVALAACDKKDEAAPPPPAPAPTKPREATRSSADRGTGDLSFTEIVTANGKREDPLPLIVLLHGRGDRPESFASLWADFGAPSRMIAVKPPLSFGKGYQWFDAPVAGDQTALAEQMKSVGERLAKTIADVRARRPTWGKAIVIGFSQGAMMAYWLAVNHSELVDTAIPVAGFLPPPLVPAKVDAPRKADLVPVRCGEDDVIPNEKTDATNDALRKLGFRLDVHTFDGVGHHLWPHMAADIKKAMLGEIGKITAGERNPE